jgi:pyridoxamine 5'-phosphate oxidase
MAKLSLPDIRNDYRKASLGKEDIAADPFDQFRKWFDEALESGIEQANAMTLATGTTQGHISARIVLLKGIDASGFYFYTNYQSAKARQIAENPYGALVFFWKELERQVRIEGQIARASEKNSDTYYVSRPEKSRISAWASPQSSVIPDRAFLEAEVRKVEEKFRDKPVTRPPFWGGYVLQPSLFEFWQGRSNRLHDRFVYTPTDGRWQPERLAP